MSLKNRNHHKKLGAPIIHGMYGSPEYEVWHSIKQRCNNPKDKGYKNYGGRGITVCTEWNKSFIVFFNHVGHRPSPTHSIDRIKNNGNYEPGNVRWATIQEQHNNYRQNHNISLHGWTMTLTQWARFVGINPLTLSGRIKWKWPLAKAIFQPIAIKHRHKIL